MIIDVSRVADPHPAPIDPLVEAYKLGIVPAGPSGAPATVEIGSVTTLDPGQPATVTNSGTPSAVVLDFGIPSGLPGASGLDPAQNLADVDDAETALSNLGGAPAADTYTKTEVGTLLSGKADASNVYTKTQVDNALGDLAEDVTVALDDLHSRIWFMGSM
jgi:hypothetical protein